MIDISFDGELVKVDLETTLQALLVGRGVDVENPFGMAVACNGAVVSYPLWKERLLQAGDSIECLYAIQGG